MESVIDFMEFGFTNLHWLTYTYIIVIPNKQTIAANNGHGLSTNVFFWVYMYVDELGMY